MFVELWFDVRSSPAVNAERLVVGACRRALGTERSVLHEDARLLVVRPVEGRVGVAVASLFFHSDLLISLILSRVIAMLNTLFILNWALRLVSLRCRFSRMLGWGFFLSSLSPSMNTARG